MFVLPRVKESTPGRRAAVRDRVARSRERRAAVKAFLGTTVGQLTLVGLCALVIVAASWIEGHLPG